jgi:tetratricopeptide (TPR) repeat protein
VTARFSRSELIWLPLVLVAALVIYLPGLGNAPVFDDALLTDGLLFEQYRSLREFRTRMFSYGSFVWLQALFGDGWWKQRLVNVFIHLGVVVSLWAFYREILRHIAVSPDEPAQPSRAEASYERSPALGLAIGVFAINPVAVYAVAYLIQRSILLATLFVVLGLWLFARAVAQRGPWLHLLAVLCYVLAVMSKEHAILAPLAALPIYIVVARPSGQRLAIISGVIAALVAAAAVVLSLRYGEIIGKPFDEYSRVYLTQLAKLSPDAVKHSFALSILNQAWLFFEYGVRWFLPYSGWMSINMRPPFPVSWATFPQVLGLFGYIAILAGGFLLVIRYRDWRALAGVSLLLPALLFATEFATVWVQDPFVLYRSYLWAIGIPGLVFIMVHGMSTQALAAISAAIAALFIWQGLDRVVSMETPVAAWTDAIEKLPRDPRSVGRWFPYLNRGSAYVEGNQFALAMRDFDNSAALGDMGMGALSLGSLLSASGRHQQALAAFDRAEKEGYDLYNLPFQRALALLATGKPLEARRQLEKTWAMNPPSPTRELTLLHLGRIAMQEGNPGEAIRVLRALQSIDPANKEGRLLLGMAFVTIRDYGHAFEVLDKLVAEGAKGPPHYARALANYGLKRKAEALADIETAIRLAPDNPNLREWQAKIKAMP